MADQEAAPAKRARRYPVVLFFIKDWPPQDPNRRMVFKVFYDGEAKAMRAHKRLNKRLGKEATFELASLTTAEARKIRLKGYGLRDVVAREKELRAKADAEQ